MYSPNSLGTLAAKAIGAFLGATENWSMPRKVANISSGLGRRAMASQAGYCAAKAGMDHFTRCLALDEALKPNGAKVTSLAPGVIDTDMQIQLRDAPADKFPDQNGFQQLKARFFLLILNRKLHPSVFCSSGFCSI